MLKQGTQSEVADAETWSCYIVRGRKMLKHGAITQSRVADAETQKKPPEPTMLKHKPPQSAVNAVRAQFTWLKQPANCDAETTSAAMRRSCYTSRNNNTSFSSCNSIRLRETRTSYADLERRSDLG
jgi:hypothetical protein